MRREAKADRCRDPDASLHGRTHAARNCGPARARPLHRFVPHREGTRSSQAITRREWTAGRTAVKVMNDGFDLNIEAHTILRDALRARGEQRMNALMGETAQCLHTDRVRELAAMAAGVTVQEQQHVTGCVRCRSRVRAFQRAKLATPERLLEAALQQTRAA